MSGGTGHQGSAVRGTVESGGHARGPGPPDGRGGLQEGLQVALQEGLE